MAFLTCNLSQLDPAVRERVLKHLQHEDAAAYALARVEQAKISKFYQENVRAGTTKNGIGPLNFVIHPYLRNQLSAEYGPSIWQDVAFVEWLKKHHDCFRVPEVGTKIQVGYTGAARTPAPKPKPTGVLAVPSYKRLENTCG